MATATQLRNKLTTALRQLFREQKKLADRGKERFGDWHIKLQKVLAPILGEMYLWGLKQVRKGRLPLEVVESVASLAGERAVLLSRQLNDTTSDWLEEGRDTDQVFSPERIAQIVMTEMAMARHKPQVLVSKRRKEKLQWQTGGKPCPRCQKLAGRVVKAGGWFVSGKDKVQHPPLHPHCYCRLVVVR